MGTQQTSLFDLLRLLSHEMAPMKPKASAKPMTKGAIAEELATACELKKAQCAKVIDSLAEIATKEVTKSGVFKLPGLFQIKTRREAGGLRQGCHGESEACEEGGQGIPTRRF